LALSWLTVLPCGPPMSTGARRPGDHGVSLVGALLGAAATGVLAGLSSCAAASAGRLLLVGLLALARAGCTSTVWPTRGRPWLLRPPERALAVMKDGAPARSRW